MKAIIRMVEEWVMYRNSGASSSSNTTNTPSLREKSILLVKLMQYVEKRFPDDLELNAHFLELINFVYRFVLWLHFSLTIIGILFYIKSIIIFKYL